MYIRCSVYNCIASDASYASSSNDTSLRRLACHCDWLRSNNITCSLVYFPPDTKLLPLVERNYLKYFLLLPLAQRNFGIVGKLNPPFPRQAFYISWTWSMLFLFLSRETKRETFIDCHVFTLTEQLNFLETRGVMSLYWIRCQPILPYDYINYFRFTI